MIRVVTRGVRRFGTESRSGADDSYIMSLSFGSGADDGSDERARTESVGAYTSHRGRVYKSAGSRSMSTDGIDCFVYASFSCGARGIET